jgi:hypothetical protein
MAFFFHGTELLGKTDRVPGLMYVATQFDHLNLFPLFPKQTYVVVEGTEKETGFHGVAIRRSWKSLFLAYVRGVCWLLILGYSFVFAVEIIRSNEPHWGYLLIPAVAVVPLAASYTRFAYRASPQRALWLAAQIGINPADVALRFVSADEVPSFLALHMQSVSQHKTQED